MAKLQLSPFGDAAGMTVRLEKGCDDSVASTPSNTPASSSRILPPPPSSAGVPMTTTRPGKSCALAFSPSAAPMAAMAMRLCPQPWPISGSASYSASTAIVGPSPPPPGMTARKAVSMPPTPRSTAKSFFSRNPTRASEE